MSGTDTERYKELLSSNVFKDPQGNIIDRETAVLMPAGQVFLEKRNKVVERYSNDFLLYSARVEAACLIILGKRRRFQPITDQDFTSFRSTLKDYLLLKDEILQKENEMFTYILRDDSYMIMTIYRVAYLVRKACQCTTIWYGQKTKLGCFSDYDFGTDHLMDEQIFSKFEKKMLTSLFFDPKAVLRLATFRVIIKNVPSLLSGRIIYMQ